MNDQAAERVRPSVDECVAALARLAAADEWDFKSYTATWNHEKATHTLVIKLERAGDVAQLRVFEG